MQVAGPPALPKTQVQRGPSVAAWVGPVLALVVGIGFGALWGAIGDQLDHSGGPLVPIAFGVLWASPGLMGLLAHRRRPALFLGAAMLEAAFGPFTWSLVFVFFILAALCLVAYERAAGEARGRIADPIVGLWCLAGGLLSFGSLYVSQDPRGLTTASSSEWTSDIITSKEAALSLAIITATILLAWFLSKPASDD